MAIRIDEVREPRRSVDLRSSDRPPGFRDELAWQEQIDNYRALIVEKFAEAGLAPPEMSDKEIFKRLIKVFRTR